MSDSEDGDAVEEVDLDEVSVGDTISEEALPESDISREEFLEEVTDE